MSEDEYELYNTNLEAEEAAAISALQKVKIYNTSCNKDVLQIQNFYHR